MKVLVACEFSGTVRDAFLRKGHEAVSCDLLPTESPGPHIEGDCIPVIRRGGWDLIIMHPPCTALAASGNRWYAKGAPGYAERLQAIEWTMDLWFLAVETASRVCLENPVGVLPMLPAQYIQPWFFGHDEQKKTGLWLKNLPPLMSSEIVGIRKQSLHGLGPSEDRWKLRSKTFDGVAEAMAGQWG
ncbi:DNA cytosine methyltransferase [Marinobacter salarius]|uniref:DNA cytosine methyltransferase n=1 Tax=Marinobacter salarius TaxID=1420917 RepID=UPI003D1160B5